MNLSSRVVDISNGPARLRIDNGLLVIDAGQLTKVPVKQIQALILSHPAVTLTASVLSTLSLENVPIISCDGQFFPAAQTVPYSAASLSAERARQQIAASKSLTDFIWKQIIEAKIRNQAAVLSQFGHEERSKMLIEIAHTLIDAQKAEALAARLYFETLFESGFNRRDDGFFENRILNYSYALLRSRVTRAICATGLNPTFGINHHNRYNSFALADDLMEPWRPLYDLKSLEVISGGTLDLTPAVKRELIEFAEQRIKIRNTERSVADWVFRSVRNCCLCIVQENESVKLDLPILPT